MRSALSFPYIIWVKVRPTSMGCTTCGNLIHDEGSLLAWYLQKQSTVSPVWALVPQGKALGWPRSTEGLAITLSGASDVANSARSH